jgi:hypothetical protein
MKSKPTKEFGGTYNLHDITLQRRFDRNNICWLVVDGIPLRRLLTVIAVCQKEDLRSGRKAEGRVPNAVEDVGAAKGRGCGGKKGEGSEEDSEGGH